MVKRGNGDFWMEVLLAYASPSYWCQEDYYWHSKVMEVMNIHSI